MRFGLVLPARVVGVVDGDTVEVELRRRVRVRLLDCWAPETHTTNQEEKQRGFAAKEYLHNLVNGKDVSLEIELAPDGKFGDQMTFGRVLGRIEIDGKDVSELMVASGHATQERTA